VGELDKFSAKGVTTTTTTGSSVAKPGAGLPAWAKTDSKPCSTAAEEILRGATARFAIAKANVTDEDDVGLGCDEGQTEQVLDLRAVDLFGPAPLEVIEGFEHGEARVPDAALDAAVLAHRGLALNQLLQIIQVRALLVGGSGGQGLVVALDVVQMQTLQLRVQSRQVSRGHDRLPRSVEVRGSDLDVEQVVATGELQWSWFRQRPGAGLQDVGDVLGTEGLEGEPVGDGARHRIG
jgi:hypothetical protein